MLCNTKYCKFRISDDPLTLRINRNRPTLLRVAYGINKIKIKDKDKKDILDIIGHEQDREADDDITGMHTVPSATAVLWMLWIRIRIRLVRT
jgi:hypothetical protein